MSTDLEAALNEAIRNGARSLNLFLNPNGDFQVNVAGSEAWRIDRNKGAAAALKSALDKWNARASRKDRDADLI